MSARRIVRTALIGFGGCVVVLAVYLVVLVLTTPSVDDLRATAPTQTSYMRLRGEQRGSADWVDLSDVSPYLVCAVVKAEDSGFFRHSGVEWGQVRKAFWGFLTGDSRIGGSTITQQLARNLYLSPDRSLHRKLREALITRRLESSLDKRRILELYLNLVEWGDGVWGAKEAARVYFGRGPGELGAFEAAFLASLLPAPRAPLEGNNQQRAVAEQRRVLHQMVVAGVIDGAQFSDARARVARLSTDLARGLPLADALGSVPATTAQTLELSPLLANECGLAQELAASERARRLARRP